MSPALLGTSQFLALEAFEVQFQYIKFLYSLRDPRKVRSFLEENQFLTTLLLEARPYITKYFPDSEVFLGVETDPEITDYQQLVALVATSLSPDNAYRRLKQFDEGWWLDVLDQAQMKLCISVEFK